MLPALRLLRPHQWIKNSFVFAGIVFAHLWNNHFLLKQTILIVCAFSLLASAMYIFNDFIDREQDANHPLKKNRPLAAGTVSNTQALFIAVLLASLAFLIGFTTTSLVLGILASYVGLNLAYGYFLKKIVYLDVLAIASGFLLRILAGTFGIGIPPSQWILICGFTLTLFLALMKRLAEPQTHYSPQQLDYLILLTAIATILSYSGYSIQHHLTLTIPFVALGILRYRYLCYKKQNVGIDLAKDLFQDWYLLFIILSWTVVIFIIL